MAHPVGIPKWFKQGFVTPKRLFRQTKSCFLSPQKEVPGSITGAWAFSRSNFQTSILQDLCYWYQFD